MKERYQVSTALNEEDAKRLEKLRKSDWQVVEILRLGIQTAEKKQRD